MATATSKQTRTLENDTPALDQAIAATPAWEYVPFGEEKPIKVSLTQARRYLCRPTRSGKVPNDDDIVRYMMLCKSRELNPWVGDAFCVGYDTKDGPEFNLITSIQALHKRAEVNSAYDGLEGGVVVRSQDGIVHREGSLHYAGETLIGGWAKVYRKDRKVPFYAELKLETYDKQRSVWNSDKAGMIRKCAVAAALREAFPTQIGGLHIAEEFRHKDVADQQEAPAVGMEGLRSRLQTAVKNGNGTQPEPPPTEDDAEQYAPDESHDAVDEPTPDDAAQAPADADAMVRYWRGELSKAKTNKQRGDTLAMASKQLGEEGMLELSAFADELANQK